VILATTGAADWESCSVLRMIGSQSHDAWRATLREQPVQPGAFVLAEFASQ